MDMKRAIIYIGLLIISFACSTSQVSNDQSVISDDTPSTYELAPNKYAIIGDIQPFESEIRVDTLEEGLYLLHLSLFTDFPSGLPKFQFQLKYPQKQIGSLWSSRTWSSGSFVNIPNYARLQSDENIISGHTNNSTNRITLASTDQFDGRYTGIDIGIEKDSLLFVFNFFKSTQPDIELLEYKDQIIIDLRDQHFSKTVRETSQWLIDQRGESMVTKIDPSLQPVYSLWYTFHKNVPLENITHYFDSISNMGFKSVLFDDGWQNVVQFKVDSTGYWDPAQTVEVTDFMAKVQASDMNVALWYSQPFAGAHRYVMDKFEGKYLQYITSSQPALDIRYPEVRSYLAKLYGEIVANWKVNGIWFDFLNGYYPDEHIIPTADLGRDFVSVRKALDSLKIQIEEEVLRVDSNISINQSFQTVGPLITSSAKSVSGFLGTSALGQVREKMVNNRLMYGNYSPFVEVMGIHPKDPAKEVARKFHSIIFGVPYISYFSYILNEEVQKTLSFWIRYWKSNHLYLTEGDFEAYNPVGRYPVIMSGNESKQIVVVYERCAPFNMGSFSFEIADIINSSDYPTVSLSGNPAGKVDYIVYNHKGDYQTKGSLKFKKSVAEIEIPEGGYARLIVK